MADYALDPSHRGLPLPVPPPEWVSNATCYTPRLLDDVDAVAQDDISIADVCKATVILLTAAVTIFANAAFLVVLNTAYYRARGLGCETRFMFSAVSANDLCTGALVLASGVYPNLFQCWPLGERFCQIQALLRGSLLQQSSLLLMALAGERYVAAVYPFSYATIVNKPVVALVFLLTLAVSFSFYSAVVLVYEDGFHFNINGLMLCEPYYLSNNALVFASCLFYFPTTMFLMYSYGTIFHATTASQRYRRAIFTTLPMLAGRQSAAAITDKFLDQKRRCHQASRSAAAISLAYIIVVTPWAIQQVITSTTRTTPPPFVDFLTSWLATSHNFISPLIFWTLNSHFRTATMRFFITKVLCRPLPLSWNFDSELDLQSSRGGALNATANVPPLSELAPEIEHYWGAILDRSFSEGANTTAAEVANATNALEVTGVEIGDIDEGFPSSLSVRSPTPPPSYRTPHRECSHAEQS